MRARVEVNSNMRSAAESGLLRVREVAVRLGVELSTIYTWVQEGRIPFVRLGGRSVRFDPQTLEGWIDSQRVEAQRD